MGGQRGFHTPCLYKDCLRAPRPESHYCSTHSSAKATPPAATEWRYGTGYPMSVAEPKNKTGLNSTIEVNVLLMFITIIFAGLTYWLWDGANAAGRSNIFAVVTLCMFVWSLIEPLIGSDIDGTHRTERKPIQ